MSFLSRIGRALQWRVDHWNIATSGWREDVPALNPDGSTNYKFARVFVHCESTIWYIRFLEWLAWDNGLALCSFLHNLPKIPRFIREWERHWDKDDPEYFAKFEDWYGEDWCGLWHSWFETPVLQWIWGLKKKDYVNEIILTPTQAKEAFKHYPERLEWVWKSMEESRQYEAEEEAKNQQEKL